eukprot:TRINITY_DN4087_c2_g1_i1.p1 TRINITY_DN4087_c2_g1~~TRINITY_DN4087_c2_g1_i1.p1  ORF type:complete len:277 (+),score=72.70 TRINITY_DN4087_c2_g1_i1:39-833(+)
MTKAAEFTLCFLNQLRMSRDTIMKWHSDPGFREVIKGTYCRVVMRNDRGRKFYRVGRVEGLGPEGNAGVVLSYGLKEKEYAIEFISNGEFTEEERGAFLNALEQDGVEIRSSQDVAEKVKAMKIFLMQRTMPRTHIDQEDVNEPLECDTEQQNSVLKQSHTALSQRAASKEKQIEHLSYEVSRVSSEANTLTGHLRDKEDRLTTQRDGQKQFRVKLKEMDYLISLQAGIIEGLQKQIGSEQELQGIIAKKRKIVSTKLKEKQQE